MKLRISTLTCALAVAGLLALAPAAFAADAAPAPEVQEAEAAPTLSVDPGDGAVPLYGGLEDERGDCNLYCFPGGSYWYYGVTRGECCGGQLTCPGGGTPTGYAFYPYQGFAEFCST
jgi:hypothetical protein